MLIVTAISFSSVHICVCKLMQNLSIWSMIEGSGLVGRGIVVDVLGAGLGGDGFGSCCVFGGGGLGGGCISGSGVGEVW